jgi:hypothetical protein
VTRDEQTGVTPLTGAERTRRWRERRRQDPQDATAAADGEVTGVRKGTGTPARGYSWPPFQPGHTVNLVHGARCEKMIAPRAQALETAVMESAEFPDLVRSPVFRMSLTAWTRAEAVASLLYEYIAGLEPGEMMTPRLAGTRAPVDLWRTAESHAAKLRGELGLTPTGYAKISRDLGLAGRAADEALERMASAGRQIREQRSAGLKVIGGTTTEAG